MVEKGNQDRFAGLLTPSVSDSDAKPDALATLRREGYERAAALGLPTRKVESWKFTNLNAVLKQEWREADGDAAGALSSATPALLPDALAALDGFVLSFVNGSVTGLSDTDALPNGVSIVRLSAMESGAMEAAAGTAAVGSLLPLDDLPIAALNTARMEDGIVLTVAEGAVVETPIILDFLSLADGAATACHPRVMIDVAAGAQVSVIEIHRSGIETQSSDQAPALSTPTFEIKVGDKAVLGHYKLQDEASGNFHLATTGVACGAGAVYDGFVLHLGEALARNELRVAMWGERGDARLNGAYIGTGDAHIDNTTFIDHAVPQCHSREVYKGVLDDRARGVFQGKILVRPDAQQTDGHQMNRALLLSPGAEIDSKPELEIYADDVQCSHGATAGELEEDSLFYLRARGIQEDVARSLLVQAFLVETVEDIQRAPVREAFRTILEERLAHLFANVGSA